MTAITRSKAKAMASSPPQPSVETSQPGKNSSGNPRSTTNFGKFLPSISAKEAHARFFSAVSEGVDMLVREHGHGRDRATENLLNEFADGCSPSEQEVRHKNFSQFLVRDLRTICERWGVVADVG
mmetsp:Transcript_26810/g.54780  ORF Transcript_26810/g.54780 Transcript_26810/m.54780 type:complete len:125 (-) Transcript_26810:854-1228(-)